MKKINQTDKDELRAEYKRSDFPGGLVRGKYADRIRESSNIVVLKPEVAEVFPNEEAVNSALLSLIALAQKTTCPNKRSTARPKKNNLPISKLRKLQEDLDEFREEVKRFQESVGEVDPKELDAAIEDAVLEAKKVTAKKLKPRQTK
jgi:hypothetical protein